MAQQTMNKQAANQQFADIVAADEAYPSIGRQILNGLTGTLVLLLTGIIILVMVLWKVR
jgi:hypothetical protein